MHGFVIGLNEVGLAVPALDEGGGRRQNRLVLVGAGNADRIGQKARDGPGADVLRRREHLAGRNKLLYNPVIRIQPTEKRADRFLFGWVSVDTGADPVSIGDADDGLLLVVRRILEGERVDEAAFLTDVIVGAHAKELGGVIGWRHDDGGLLAAEECLGLGPRHGGVVLGNAPASRGRQCSCTR